MAAPREATRTPPGAARGGPNRQIFRRQTTRIPSSTSATVRWVTIIQQKQLRNEVGDVLRRAEAGEEFTVTVAGRPVAQIVPLRRDTWVPGTQLADLLNLPADPMLATELQAFRASLADPWSE